MCGKCMCVMCMCPWAVPPADAEVMHRDMEAVRSADVLLSMHGAASANFILMRNGTALLEVVPYEFLRHTNGHWIHAFNPTTSKRMNFRVRYFALSIEDPSLNIFSTWERQRWPFQLPKSLSRLAFAKLISTPSPPHPSSPSLPPSLPPSPPPSHRPPPPSLSPCGGGDAPQSSSR